MVRVKNIWHIIVVSLYGPAAAAHLEIVYTEAKAQRDILKAQMHKLRPSTFTPEKLYPIKEKELGIWKNRCSSLAGKASLEKLTAAFFTKVSVFKGFHIEYTVAPEVSQFFGLTNLFDKLTLTEPKEEPERPLLL